MLQQLLNGLILGSVYALLALGYTMVYGIIKLINFAHGDIYMVGAFVGYFTSQTMMHQMGLPGWLAFLAALVLAMVVCAILGVVIEALAYRPIRHSTRISALITAIGVSFLLEYTMVYFFSADTRHPGNLIPATHIHLGPIEVSPLNLLVLLVSIVLMLALQYIVQYTKMGKAMRAVSVDSDAAQLMGIDVNRTISFTFALGSALAGAAGVLISVLYNSLDPLMGMVPGIKAFIAAVLGGIGLIPGAAIGGFVIGILETLAVAFGLSAFKDLVVYAVLIIILLVRPAGILGKNVKEKV